MKFRFIGTYTGGHDSINACGVVFHGRNPSEVTDSEATRRLSNHIEFEAVYAPAVAPEPTPDSAPLPPKKRGRPKKVASNG